MASKIPSNIKTKEDEFSAPLQAIGMGDTWDPFQYGLMKEETVYKEKLSNDPFNKILSIYLKVGSPTSKG